MNPFEEQGLLDKYSFIIVGSGLAGLSLCLELLASKMDLTGRILLVDKSFSNYPDRTWCFWDSGNFTYKDLITKEWRNVRLCLSDKLLDIDLGRYRYKMMDSQDFRHYAFSEIEASGRVDMVEAIVTDISQLEGGGAVVMAGQLKYIGQKVFDSRFNKEELNNYSGNKLWQQFRGWYIETEAAVFDQNKATLMDFRTNQEDAVAFYYVLPISPKKALIEFTLFTLELKPREFYENALNRFLNEKVGGKFTIISEEDGIIPMTDLVFSQKYRDILPIGTAGGWTKPSTGYTFSFVRREVENIVYDLEQNIHPIEKPKYFSSRFWYYDRILLRLISEYPEKGAHIFFSLFQDNPVSRVFKFLDNRTSLWEEFLIFVKLPVILFVKMAVKEVFKKRK